MKEYIRNQEDDTGRYFILDPEHDPLAAPALRHYAYLAREQGNTILAEDIMDWIDRVADSSNRQQKLDR